MTGFLLHLSLAPSPVEAQVPLYVAFVLHMHQPVYYPGVQLSWDYFNMPTDPGSSTTILQVFEDCGFCYSRPAYLVNTYPEVNLTVHFSGSLIWQLDWLSKNGFSSKGTSLGGIWDDYRRAIQTGRMEMLIDGFYHPIFPLIERGDADFQFRKMSSWYSTYFQTEAHGFYPPEMAFDMQIIPWLTTDFGSKWTLFDSFHIEGLPNKDKWSREYCEAAFRPHLAEYGGIVIIVIPREHWLGQNQSDGFDPIYLLGELEKIQQWNTDPSKPLLVVIVSDGENGWMRQAGGGYYDWFWPGLLNGLADPKYSWVKLTTISSYLRNVYTPSDYIQIERGSWGVGGTNLDLSTWAGSTLDNQMWARVAEVRQQLHDYEQNISGSLAQSYMTRAWGYFAMAETSCYWFWDTQNWAEKCYTALDLALGAAENARAHIGESGEVLDELGLTGTALPPDFGISIDPLSGSIHPGGSLEATVSVKAIMGYNSTVSLSASGQPGGVSVSFSQTSGTPPFSSTAIINVSDGASTGDCTIIIKGVGADGKEHACSYVLNITTTSDFTISVNPTSSSIKQGGSLTATVRITAIGGYDKSIGLSSSGQPPGVSVSFSPGSGTPDFSSVMTISASSTAPTGTHTITIKGTASDGKERTASYTLTVTGFPPEPSPITIQSVRYRASIGKVKIICEVSGDVDNVAVRWSVDGKVQETPMSCIDAAAGKWAVELGPFKTDTEVNFGIRAASGGQEVKDFGATGEGYNVKVITARPEAESPIVPIIIACAIVAISFAFLFQILRRGRTRARRK
ncbi:MAG: hypothetical protein QMD00_04620 [Hadesarchaea archaeon]|nr:hypothetical protein [Hadesarchaea archaeon]